MGSAVQPETDPLVAYRAQRDTTDPLAAYRASQVSDPLAAYRATKANLPKYDHPGPIDFRSPSDRLPQSPALVRPDATAVARGAGKAPVLNDAVTRIASGIGGGVSDIVHHPQHLVTGMLQPFVDIATVPLQGETGHDAQGHWNPAVEGFAGKLGINVHNPTPEQARFIDNGARQTPAELAKNAATAGAIVAGGKLGDMVAGKVGSRLVGRAASNALVGAASNPTDPLVGAVTQATLGEPLHHAVGAVTPDPEPVMTDAGDVEYRHAGPPQLSPSQLKTANAVVGSILGSPFAAIRQSHPDLTAAAERALSAPANAKHIGQVQAQWVTEGFSPQEQTAFVRQLQADRLQHLAQIDPSKAHDAQFAKNLSDIQSEIPAGFAESAAFQTMLGRHRDLILSQTEPAATNAGLAPERFANLPNAYLRLVADRNAPAGTYAEDVGGTGFRPPPSTKTTTASQSATGTANAYSPSYAEAVTADARDKVVKAARNNVYQEVAKIGTPIGPKEVAPDGMVKLSFDDRANVIDDPSQARITLAVPRDVAQAVKHVQAELTRPGATTPAGAAWQAAGKLGAKAALFANPAAATTHMNTLANVSGSVPDVGKPLNNLVGLVPGGTTLKGVTNILSVDRTLPETRVLEARLSRIGALRPEAEPRTPAEQTATSKLGAAFRKAKGAVSKLDPHEVLFGEDGVDKRTRLDLAQRYIDAYKQRFDGAEPSDAELRKFVVDKAGNYIPGLSGSLVDWLQRSNLSLFARMAEARLRNAASTTVGASGLPAANATQATVDRAGTLLRGPVGYGVGLTALNLLLSGHRADQNEPGHEADLQVTTDSNGKPIYIKGSFLNPLVSTAANGFGIASAAKGDTKGAVRNLVNTGAGVLTSHPLIKAASEIATGHEPYIDRQGNMAAVGHPTLSGTSDVRSRLIDAGKNMTSLGQATGDGPQKNPGMNPPVGKILGDVLPQITSTATPGGADRNVRTDVNAVLDDRLQQMYRLKDDPNAQRQLLEDTKAEFARAGLNTGPVEQQLRRAMAKAGNTAAAAGSLRKFNAKYGRLRAPDTSATGTSP